MAIKKTVIIDVDAQGAVDGLDKTADAVEGVGSSTEYATETLEQYEARMKKVKAANKAAGKSSSKTGGLFKKFGSVMGNIGKVIGTGLGIGILVSLFGKLTEILGQNQKVVDGINTVFTALSIALNTVIDTITETVGVLSEANGGFDATKEVIGSLLSLAIVPLKLAFNGIKAAVLGAQLIWEKSFFGSGDTEKIKELEASLLEIKETVVEIGTDAIASAKNIGENFLEAVDEVGTATKQIVSDVSDAISEIDIKAAIAQAKSIEDRKKSFELLQIAQGGIIAQYELEAEQLRQIRDNDLNSISDRIKANEELGQVLADQSEAEKKNIQSRIGFLQSQESLLGGNFERQKEIAALAVELQGVDAKIAGQKSEQLSNENALIREKLDLNRTVLEGEQERAEILDASLVKDIVREDQRLQKELDLSEIRNQIKLDQLDANRLLYKKDTQERVDADERYKTESLRIETETAAKKKAIAKAELDFKIKATQQVLGGLSALLAQFAEDNKGIAIAGVIVDAAQAAIGIWAGWASLGPWGIAGAALQTAALVAASVKSINTINNVDTKSGGSPPSFSGPKNIPIPRVNNSLGTTQNPNFTGQAAQTNAITDSLGVPLKAYVVSTDVTTQQELDRKIEDNASFG